MALVRDAVSGMRDVQSALLSEEVEYRRAGGGSVRLRAVPGRTVFHSRGEHGTWMRVETRDFVVRAGDMDFDPQAGDEVSFDGRVYEVLAPNNEPCWRWSDPFRTARRIHSKLTGGEP